MVERNLAKVEVASSRLVSRSKKSPFYYFRVSNLPCGYLPFAGVDLRGVPACCSIWLEDLAVIDAAVSVANVHLVCGWVSSFVWLGYNKPIEVFLRMRRSRCRLRRQHFLKFCMADKKQEPTFEEALSELEAIVEKMENAGMALEESVQAFTRGTQLVGICNQKLQSAEQQIKKLEADGTLSDFKVDGQDQGAQQ